MLVLSRRIREEIFIGKNIRLIVLGVDGKRVRLGIRAPSAMPVDRREIHDCRLRNANGHDHQAAKGEIS